jgi:hypothetical protein
MHHICKNGLAVGDIIRTMEDHHILVINVEHCYVVFPPTEEYKMDWVHGLTRKGPICIIVYD